MKQLLNASLCACLLICPLHEAQAAHRHPHHRHHAQREAGNISGIPVTFVRGRLVCAINVSRWLNAHGFASPMSWSSQAIRHYRRVPREQVQFGDVRFNWRRGGGHNMVALGWVNGRLICRNPSSRHQTWVDKACPPGGEFYRTGRV